MLGKCSTTELPLASSLGLSNASFQLSLYSGWAIHNPYHREITQILFWTALSFCLFLQILFFKGCKTNKPTTEINQTPKTYCLIFKENFELKKKNNMVSWRPLFLLYSSKGLKPLQIFQNLGHILSLSNPNISYLKRNFLLEMLSRFPSTSLFWSINVNINNYYKMRKTYSKIKFLVPLRVQRLEERLFCDLQLCWNRQLLI